MSIVSMKAPARGGRTGSRSRALLLVIAVAVAVLVAFVLTRGAEKETTAATAPPASGGAGGAASPGGGVAARRAPVAAAASADEAEHMAEKLEFNRLKAQGARDAIAGIELNRDYPFWTRPLSDANRWAPPEPFHQFQDGPNTPGRAIELWPEKKEFLAGEPVIVHARVVDGGPGGTAIAVDEWWAITDSQPSLGRPVFDLAFRDDGAGGDAAAGDRIYTARVPITKVVALQHPGLWGYRVRATVKGEPLETSNAFLVWPTDVRLTGQYRDALEEGSLAIYAEVEAREAATIQVRGELHGPNGEDIGFGWVNQEVPAGKTEVRLLFWGKVLHDRGLDGPYRIEHVVLGYPNHKLIGPEATEVAHTTRAYKASDFRADGFNAADPLFADQLAVFQDELAKAERGELEPMTEE